jgi:peptidyl-prolyl cis-trans isomerase D
MSVIQKIQDKYAKLMAIIIALALMIFVVMLAFENGGRLFSGGNSTTVGKVNGTAIDYTEFMAKVDKQQKNMEARGYGSGAQLQQQAVESVWNEEVNGILQSSEQDKLGITVGKKEMGDILYGPNAPEDLKKLFTDSATGMYNGQLAKSNIDQMLKMKRGTAEQLQQRERFIDYINYLETARLGDKYNSLLSNSVNYPKWFIEKEIADKSQLAKIALVRENYSSNTDTTIKVSDKEIEEYFSKHKKDKEYKQPESRSIAYVAFSTFPSAKDSSAVKSKVLELKPEFDTVSNIQKFFAKQGITTFNDNYLIAASVATPAPAKDSILKLPVNAVYGPYLENGSYTLAKLTGVRQQPEMVKVRHILISTATQNPQTSQMTPTKDTVVARHLIDSIQTAIKNGSKFDTLAVKFSDDSPTAESKNPGKFNKVKGGIYDSVRANAMVPEFNDFIFGNPAGTKGVVKTDFGYHYIEILAHEGGATPAYKIAYLPKPIETSQETETNASNEAAKFAGDSRDKKTFDTNAVKLLKEKGISKSVAGDILPTSYQVGALGQSRTFVKNIYKASLGEVLEPEKVGENYVVAIVTEINEEGAMSLTKVKPKIEARLHNRKIAEKLTKKIGTVTTLEAAAATLGGKQIEMIDSLRIKGPQTTQSARSIESESRLIGAAFNPANRGKVVPQVIEGTSAVYVVRVDNVTATAVGDANVAEQRKTRYQMGKQQAMGRSPIQVLRDAATIKDWRIKFF